MAMTFVKDAAPRAQQAAVAVEVGIEVIDFLGRLVDAPGPHFLVGLEVEAQGFLRTAEQSAHLVPRQAGHDAAEVLLGEGLADLAHLAVGSDEDHVAEGAVGLAGIFEQLAAVRLRPTHAGRAEFCPHVRFGGEAGSKAADAEVSAAGAQQHACGQNEERSEHGESPY
jgi:hypothetical protein